jgi:hypothetical protein
MDTAGVGSNRRPAPHPTYIAHHPSVNTHSKLTKDRERKKTISTIYEEIGRGEKRNAKGK